MNDEELKRLWQNQPFPEPPKDVATLVTMAGQKHRKFQRSIFWRDFREAGVALALIPIFVAFARQKNALWTSYLSVVALAFIAGFIVIDRLRWRKAAAGPGETIADTIASALTEVEHQIWLLRNVLWWYIGPSMGALIIEAAHQMLSGDRHASGFIGRIAVYLLVGAVVWWVNQQAVKRSLEPQRSELQKLLEAVR